MVKGVLRVIKAITDSPWLGMAVGLILIGTGLVEAWNTLAESLWRVGTHHGVIALGLVHVVRALPEVFEGLEYAARSSRGG